MREADGGGAVGVGRLGVGEPPELGRGEGGDRDDADGIGPRLPAGGLVAVAEFGDQVGRGPGGTDVVPEQRVPDDGAVLVEADHAVLLAADGDRGDVGEPAGGRRGGGEGLLPGAGSDLGAAGDGARGPPHELAGVRVADHDLAGLRRGVDPRDEGHLWPAVREGVMRPDCSQTSSAEAGDLVQLVRRVDLDRERPRT